MKRTELRKQLIEIFAHARGDLSVEECLAEANHAIIEVEQQRGWTAPNGSKPWSDAELAGVLSDAPTRGNILKHARAFGRSVGSVELVYRWAVTPDKEIKRKREDDSFVQQVKSIAKKLGWRA